MSASLRIPTGSHSPADAHARGLSGLVARPWFWAVVVAVGLAIPIVNQVRRPLPPPLAVLSTLAPFRLTDENGRAFGSEDLRGYVWVAGFIFTRCPTICPAITAKMVKVQHRARGIEPGFRLVAFSVDPAHDTPPVLQQYGRSHRASPRMWKFLTGPLDDVKAAVESVLKVSMGSAPEGEQDFASIFHGTHFVLVDQELRIRGYYDSSAPDVEERLLHDATMLINRGR